MKAQLIIDFVTFYKSEIFKDFEIFGQKKPIQYEKEEILNIPNGYFNDEYSKLFCLKLHSEKNMKEIILELHNNINYCCVFCDDYGKTYHLLFNQEKKGEENKIDICVLKSGFHLEKFDTNSTKYRKRFILANADFQLIKINDTDIMLSDYTKGLNTEAESYQFSIYNLKEKLIVSKALEMPSQNINFENIYIKNYQVFQNFIKDFKKSIKNEKTFNKEFIKLYKKYKNLTQQNYFLNASKKKIENELNKKEYLDFFYNMAIFKIFNERMRSSLKAFDTISSFITFFDGKINKIKEDVNLKLSQKILLINEFCHISNNMKLDSFLKSDIKYYIMSKKADNSILDIIQRFFKDYINNLNEDSDIFFKLLELDSGIGYLNGKKFTCFNMGNIKEIKAHLNDIFIESLITYKVNKNIHSNLSNKIGIVSVNLKDIPNFDKFFLEDELKDNEIIQGKNVAAKIIISILHEIYDFKKFIYDKEKLINSPQNLIPDVNSYSNGKNEIYSLQNKNIFDARIFYEPSFGKIGDYYTIEIIDCMNEYGDLLDDINLWINDLESFKDYFKYKYILLRKNIPLNCPKNIKDRIQYFKKLVLEKGIDIESFYMKEPKTEKKLLGKKRDIIRKDTFPYITENSFGKINIKNIEDKEVDEDEDSKSSNDENAYFDFDSMSYDELIELYYSGKLKGDNLFECHKRISAYEIQTKTK